MEEAIEAAGARLVWVLEQDPQFQAGTMTSCVEVMDALGGVDAGLCVGDGETEPTPGAFDDSPFSVGRGFDLIVDRRTMEILWTSAHGSPSGNENLDGDEVLAVVEGFAAER